VIHCPNHFIELNVLATASRQAIRFWHMGFGGFTSALSLFACSGGGEQCECGVSGGVTHQPVEPGEGVLKAGILTEDGALADTQTGTPQVGFCLPLIANVALSVLDEHFVASRLNHEQRCGCAKTSVPSCGLPIFVKSNVQAGGYVAHALVASVGVFGPIGWSAIECAVWSVSVVVRDVGIQDRGQASAHWVAWRTNRRMLPGASDWGAWPAPSRGAKVAPGTASR
jgi:hypothetical protein